jgi:predicted metal-dependent HD superfamily phosphohydrolase
MTLDPQLRERLWSELLPRYSEPHRAYHNVQHINECLQEFQSAKHLAHDPGAVELAILYHDAIYDPTRHDNEDASATLAASKLNGLLLNPKLETIRTLIAATKHNNIPTDPDAQLIVDIDLAILGQPVPRFEEYEIQIRREYQFAPESIFRQKRAEILESFLARRRIYSTTFFQSRYEKTARQNLQMSLTRLLRPLFETP